MKSNRRHRDLLPCYYKKSIKCALVASTCPQEAKDSLIKNGKFLFDEQSRIKRNNGGLFGIDQPLIKNSPSLRESTDSKYNDKAYRNDVTILLIGLVIVFMICQLPSTILRLMTYKNRQIMFNPIYGTLLDISNFLIVLNSTINCLLYVMLGKKFRKEFLRTMCPDCFLNQTSTQIYMRRLSFSRNMFKGAQQTAATTRSNLNINNN